MCATSQCPIYTFYTPINVSGACYTYSIKKVEKGSQTRKDNKMSNSIFGQGFATVSDYPTGLMNTCQCGQVVLAPATIHEMCTPEGDSYGTKCYHSRCGRSLPNRKDVK